MKIKNLACIASIMLASLSGVKAGTTLAAWTYDSQSPVAPYNTNSATTGVGTAVVVNMANSYNGSPTTGNADVFATNGASSGVGSKAWRIQGTPGIGWSTNAPLGSQGVQFSASSVGYYQVKVSFDVYATHGAEARLQVQYNFDRTNWINATNLSSTGAATIGNNANPANNLVVGSYVVLANGWNNHITADLSGIPGVDNNTNILIRLVNASTGTNCLTTTGGKYNNTSGYWGFDNVNITGVSFSTVTKWGWDAPPAPTTGFSNSPAPAIGTGTAFSLGMENTYTFASGAPVSHPWCDIAATGSPYPSTGRNSFCWRIRGGTNAPGVNVGGAPNSGWNTAAPIATQGAEFDVPTTVYTNILVAFDIYFTSQAPAKMCVQYTTDGSTWLPVPNLAYAGNSTYVTNNPGDGSGSVNTVTNLYFWQTGGSAFYDNVIVDLTGVSAVNMNPKFGIRIVNAATGADCINALTPPSLYNNLSGNVRFDNVIISGQYAGLASPVLTNQANATVDAPFTNTFADDPTWRSQITAVYVNGSILTNTAYTTNTPGMIIFNPTNSSLLQVNGIKIITVDAFNYAEAKVTQPLSSGVPVDLNLIVQPAGPSASGGTLVANPVLAVTDQWGNGTTVAPDTNVVVTASVGGGATTWTLGGSTNQSSVGGFMVFSNLTAKVTGSTAVAGAYITFTVSNYKGVGSPVYVTNSSLFNIGAPTTPFTPGNLAVLQVDANSANSTFSVIEVNPAMAGQTTPVSVTPISATGTNALRMANSGSCGRLSLSDDGTLVCFAAFADDSSATPDETLNLSRAAGALNYTNLFAKPVSYLSTSTGGSQARSCTTVNNTDFVIDDKGFLWLGGPGSINASFNNNNNVVVKAFGGQVYVLTQKSSGLDPYNAMFGVDVSDPMNPTYNVSLGYPLGVDGNAQDFYMISTNGGVSYDVLYIMDSLTKPTQLVINKYSLVATSDPNAPAGVEWQSNGTYMNNDGGDSFFATTNGSGGVYLFYTTSPGSSQNNEIVRLTDASGWNAPINITSSNMIYQASGGAYLKGLTFVPQQVAHTVELIPPPVLIAAVGVTTNNAFSIALSPDDSNWRSAITSVTVNGSTLLPAAYTVQPGAIVFDPSQSALLSPGSKNITVQATGYSAAKVVQIISVNPIIGGVSLSGGSLSFTFTDIPNSTISVSATNDITVPKAIWPVIGAAVESPAGSGNYQFTDPNPATNSARYYILR